MNAGIGDGKTREDVNQYQILYAAYAQGRELRGLVAIVGEDALVREIYNYSSSQIFSRINS